MLNILLERLRQKKRTVPYPKTLPAMPPRFRGRPLIDASRCLSVLGNDCAACAKVCPTGAISFADSAPVLDTALCSFCGACAMACAKLGESGERALFFSSDWRLASTSREGLLVKARDLSGLWTDDPKAAIAVAESGTGAARTLKRLRIEDLPPPPIKAYAGCAAFARSFRLRQVSAAGCGACEADFNVLGTVVFDLARFGIDYVASPRHADALLITGPVPRNMREALFICDNATPKPRAVIAAGACAISGGLYRALPDETSEQNNAGVDAVLGVDLYIPGCPPHPYTNLDALLRFLGRPVAGA